MAYLRINVANLSTADLGREVFKQSSFHINGKPGGFYKKGKLAAFSKVGKLYIGGNGSFDELPANECFFEEETSETNAKP